MGLFDRSAAAVARRRPADGTAGPRHRTPRRPRAPRAVRGHPARRRGLRRAAHRGHRDDDRARRRRRRVDPAPRSTAPRSPASCPATWRIPVYDAAGHRLPAAHARLDRLGSKARASRRNAPRPERRPRPRERCEPAAALRAAPRSPDGPMRASMRRERGCARGRRCRPWACSPRPRRCCSRARRCRCAPTAARRATNSGRKSPATSMPPSRSARSWRSRRPAESRPRRSSGGQRHRPHALAARRSAARRRRPARSSLPMTPAVRWPERDQLRAGQRGDVHDRTSGSSSAARAIASASTTRPSASVLGISAFLPLRNVSDVGRPVGAAAGHVLGDRHGRR